MEQRSHKKRNRKSQNHHISNFSSPLVRLPDHLNNWPKVNVYKPPGSAPEGRRPKNLSDSNKIELEFSKLDRPLAGGSSVKKEPVIDVTLNKKKISLSDDDDEEDTSSDESEYDSAPEGTLAKDRSGSNLIKKTDGTVDNLSTGDDVDTTDDSDAVSDIVMSNSKEDGSQVTLEEGSSERKAKLEEATASQKKDKKSGKKKNKEKGGKENVFDARSPLKQAEVHGSTSKSSAAKAQKDSKKYGDVLHGSRSINSKASGSRSDSSDSDDSPSLAKLLTKHNKAISPQKVPVRSQPFESSQGQPLASQPTSAQKEGRASSAALTEAQRQAILLQKRDKQEFSSKAFEASDSDDGQKDKDEEEITLSAKKKRKKRKSEAAEPNVDPVEAEIAKQAIKYKEYIAKRVRENPEHYGHLARDTVYELSSSEESGKEERTKTNGVKKSRKASSNPLSSPAYAGLDDPNRSVPKKEKKDKKRKRGLTENTAEEPPAVKDSHKKRKTNSNNDHEIPSKTQDSSNTTTTKPTKKAQSSPSQPLPSTQKQNSNALQTRTSPEFTATLKSLWTILPKSLLHTTMVNLNKANRATLHQKLELCRSNQTNNNNNQKSSTPSNIRIVTHTDPNNDLIELLEENGVISVANPHTMSSDLTLLTAARNLIVLLSGTRVGLDLRGVVMGRLLVEEEGKGKEKNKDGEGKGEGREGEEGVTSMSVMEEELSRIAGERQREIERLREENRVLSGKVKRMKR